MTTNVNLITVTECINFEKRLSDFNFEILDKLAILPSNFESAKSRSELQHVAEVSTIKTLLRSKKIKFIDLLEEDKKQYIHNYDWGWIAPTIYVSSLLQESTVNITLGVIANYVTDFLKGKSGNKVKFSFVVERDNRKSYAKIDYSGPIDTLPVEEIIDRILKEMKNE